MVLATSIDFELISDDAFYGAGKTIIDEDTYPTGQNTKQAMTSLKALHGRHLFFMNETRSAREKPKPPTGLSQTRSYATLRIDAEADIISGDFHSDIHRKEWMLSFRSQTIFGRAKASGTSEEDWAIDGWNLFAICSTFFADPYKGTDRVMAIAIRHDGGRITAARFFITNANGRADWDVSFTDDDTYRAYPSFRFLSPVHLIDEKANTDEAMSAIVHKALGEKLERMRALFEASEVGIHWRSGYETEPTPVLDENPFHAISRYQWSDDPYRYVILFSSAESESFGTVLELSKESLPLSKVRLGAIVYLGPIIRGILKAHKHGTWIDHLDEIVSKVCRTYIHEVGHLLNLPHTWQRHMFDTPSLESSPADPSIMGYGSRFPLGAFMNASRKWRSRKNGISTDVLTDHDAAYARSKFVGTALFTPSEKSWLRHAPFDHASPGGPQFTARMPPPMELGPKSAPKNSSYDLSLELWDSAYDDTRNEYLFMSGLGKAFNRQAIFGEVALEIDPKTARLHPFHFAFQAPSLSLLIREEFPELPDRDAAKRVLEIPAAQLPSGWRMEHSRGGSVKTPLAVEFHNQIQRPMAEIRNGGHTQLVYRRLLPFFNPATFIKGFAANDTGVCYTLQVVLRPIGHIPIYSNSVKIRFESVFRTYSDLEHEILTHPHLAQYLDAVFYLDRNVNIANLRRPSRHSVDVEDYEPAFGLLPDLIDKLPNPGSISPNLFEHLMLNEFAIRTGKGVQKQLPNFELSVHHIEALRQRTVSNMELFELISKNFPNS